MSIIRTTYAIVAICLFSALSVLAAPQVDLNEGIFFEAEDYDKLLHGEGFAEKIIEQLGSNGQVLVGIYKPGAVCYRLMLPAEGEYVLWLRCAAPADVHLKLGINTTNEENFLSIPVARTADDLEAPNAYQWRKLTQCRLIQGENLIVLGQGALRPDCFFLAQRPDFVPTPELFKKVKAKLEAPKGVKLPVLIHSRTITRHPEWLKHALRPCYAHFEWDPKMTAKEWCRRAREAGANVIFGAGEMPAGTINGKIKPFPYTLFNANPNFKFPPNYKLDYAWTREFCDAAHAHGLKMVLYDGAYRSLDPLLVEHPEWRQQHANGKPYPEGFGSWHSPYRRAYIERWVKVAKMSGLDGIMIDMLFTGPPGGDFSVYTVNAFKKQFGVEPPRQADPRNLIWQRWIDFQTWTREEVLLELTEALHAVSPEIAVIPNQTVGWIFDGTDRVFLSTGAARCADGLLEEMGWDYRQKWNRPWAWPVSYAWQNLFLRCRTRPGYGQMWHMLLNFPEVHAQCIAFSMLANGTAPGLVTGGNWPVMTQIWRHIQACEPWIEENELVPWMALHFGEDTLHWYANARGQQVYQAYLKNLFGLFQVALEMHLPVEIITDDDLADVSRLRRYATVLLPNSACLSEAQGKALEAYVRQGGGLVATFETGCFDENGTRRDTPLLQELLGAAQQDAVLNHHWTMPLHGTQHPILDHPEIQNSGTWNQGMSEPASSGALYTGPRERLVGTVSLASVAKDAMTVPLSAPNLRPPSLTQEKPGLFKTLVARQVDKGKVVFFPLDIGHAYYVFNHMLSRRLITRALEWTAARPSPLKTSALMSVQTVLYQRGDARIVHLVNDVSSFGRAAAPNPEAFTAFRYEVAPMRDVTVAVEGHFREALLLPEGRKLDVKVNEGYTEISVPRLDIHAMVVFQ